MTPFVIGLTGGIGAGKTSVSDGFAALGIDVIDADICARQIVEPGTPALEKITAHFGQHILLENGELDRQALRSAIFNDEQQKTWLNELLHPLIRAAMLTQIESAQSAYCILSVPLLIENNMQSLVDRILVVDVPEMVQIDRVMQRDGSNEALVRAIMQSQVSRQQRLAAADDVIDNSTNHADLIESVKRLHQQYSKMASDQQLKATNNF